MDGDASIDSQYHSIHSEDYDGASPHLICPKCSKPFRKWSGLLVVGMLGLLGSSCLLASAEEKLASK